MDPATLLATALAIVAFGTGGELGSTAAAPALPDPIVLSTTVGETGEPGRRVRIEPDGAAWIRDGDGARRPFSLDADQVREVGEAADVAFARGSVRLAPRCLDCALYSVRLGAERLSFDAVGYERSPGPRLLVETIVGTVPTESTR